MTAGQVTYTNLVSKARDNVVALIDNKSNVPDPNTSSSEYRKWIYSRMPDVKATDFAEYPFMVIHPVDIDLAELGSLDMKSKMVTWSIDIEIVTSDRGYGKKAGTGMADMDSITDSIMKTMLSKTNRVTLSGYSMKFVNPETTAVITEIFHNELVFRRTVSFTSKSKLQVSA